uniref:CNH domain-containing protein n=1 Tax=Ascaris lumbricoides TaxID=6252 RepID=A0A0M3IVF5_ASCLU
MIRFAADISVTRLTLFHGLSFDFFFVDIMCEEPKPDYVHYSLNETIKCCAPILLFDEYFLIIGTSNGNCCLFNFESNMQIATVYADKERRQIIAVGQTSDICLFLHIRAFAILSIRATKNKKVLLNMQCSFVLLKFYRILMRILLVRYYR